MLKRRTLTGAAITLAVYLVIAFSHIPLVSFCATVALSVFAVYEIYRAAGYAQNQVFLWVSVIAAAMICGVPFRKYSVVLLVSFPFSVLLFGVMIFRQKKYVIDRPWKASIIAFSVVLLFQSVRELRYIQNGLYYLTGAVTICFVTDAAAYLVGSKIGKHKLLPRVSPNKTVEGAAAGLAASILVVLLYGWLLEQGGAAQVDELHLVFYAVLASIVGQFGDLAMSVVKRICGVKDFGDLLPGHGGILDRFDSHVFCIAFTLFFYTITDGYIR